MCFFTCFVCLVDGVVWGFKRKMWREKEDGGRQSAKVNIPPASDALVDRREGKEQLETHRSHGIRIKRDCW